MRRYPPWYAWCALVCSTVASIGLNLVVNGKLTERASRAEREAGRQAVCAVAVAQDQVWRETPPTTAAGRNAAEAWHHMRELYRCDQR